jgi:hypothetical protein
LSPDRPKPRAFLNEDEPFGVRGEIGEVRLEDDEGGRGIPGCLTEAVGDVLADLIGGTEVLIGEHVALGDAILPFFSGVDGVIRIAAVKLTFKADAL